MLAKMWAQIICQFAISFLLVADLQCAQSTASYENMWRNMNIFNIDRNLSVNSWKMVNLFTSYFEILTVAELSKRKSTFPDPLQVECLNVSADKNIASWTPEWTPLSNSHLSAIGICVRVDAWRKLIGNSFPSSVMVFTIYILSHFLSPIINIQRRSIQFAGKLIEKPLNGSYKWKIRKWDKETRGRDKI